jgi:hypothetical protein
VIILFYAVQQKSVENARKIRLKFQLEIRILALIVEQSSFDSDPRLQFQASLGQGVKNSQTPSASNCLTQGQPDKVRKYSGTIC